MPGVNLPPEQQFYARFAALEQQVRAIAQQQNIAITNQLDQPVLNIGLAPGSNPPKYGLQFLTPATGVENMFIGEDSTGAISLIGNNALTNPVQGTTGNSFIFTQTWPVNPSVTTVTANLAVPTGFSQAFVMCAASAHMTAGAAGASLEIQTSIGANNGQISVSAIPNGSVGAVAVDFATSLTGLTGGSNIAVVGYASTNVVGGCAANTGLMSISAVAIFLR